MTQNSADLAIIGAGAAGLMAAISAGRAANEAGQCLRIIALDGANTIGAKILVAGGGRCNVTHKQGSPQDYAGDSANSIRKILRSFTFDDTVKFFRGIGVELKQEPTGKLFPVTDRARTVLNALLDECKKLRVEIHHPWRVESIEQTDRGLRLISTTGETIDAKKAILATGGKALPKSGSDGHGYSLAKALGHTITPEVFPALAPLKLDQQRTSICQLTGLATPATLEVCSSTGKRLHQSTGGTLITHFGLSGPTPMDISRHLAAARLEDTKANIVINWLPNETADEFDQRLRDAGKNTPARLLARRIPERLARWLCEYAGAEYASPLSSISKQQRRDLVEAVTRWPAPITGDRGFTHAEATAGGIPLKQIHLTTMRSRHCGNLYLCGEILNVDGRIGGFNFQWAWSTGHLAGQGAARSICGQT